MIITFCIVVCKLVLLTVALLFALFFPDRHVPDAIGLALKAVGVHGSMAGTEDVARFNEFYHSYGNAVVLFNHPTFYDFAILVKELGHRFRFVAFQHMMIFLLNYVAQRMKCIFIQPKTGATATIVENIRRREPSTPLVAISPTGGTLYEDELTPPPEPNTPYDPCKMASFRSGAFVARTPILPVVVRYSPYEPWSSAMSLFRMMYKRMSGKPIRYKLHVLPPIFPQEGETLDALKERVKRAMESVPAWE
jgi:1-acyl-sn-glycerol-3-phosphate acyltransferase